MQKVIITHDLGHLHIHMLLPVLMMLLLLTTPTMQIDCNSTHFQFFSKFSLGKQQQVNKTLDQIQPLLKIPPISYKATDFSTFNITDVKINFRYLDSNQKAIIIGRDTIGVYGGAVEVGVNFVWVKSTMVGNINGTGQGKILSAEVLFQKLLQIDQGYLDYKLIDYYNISFEFTNFTLTRIDPSTTAATDITNILNALNVDKETQCLKTVLQREIAQFYPVYLGRNLKNQHYPLDDHFDYVYTNWWSKKNVTIPFALVPTGVDLEPEGLSLTFVSYIKDDANWKCGKAVPTEELNPRVYGGLQQFIEFSVFSNTIRYAFEKGILDTDLTRVAWQSRQFQFYVGDLYEVIPELANRYIANLQIVGKCQANLQQQVSVTKHNTTVMNTTTYHLCSLTAASTKIIEFELKLGLQVEVLANDTNFNFKVINAEGVPVFRTVPNFQVKNKPLAEHMVMHSLNRLKEGYTFGSGWKIYPRDYAHVMLADDYIVIYDSTHVESKGSLSEQ